LANPKMTKQWFTYASRDLRAAKAILAMGSEYKNISAFNCQQSVEKAIKGFLVFNGIRPPKSHSIKDLAKFVEELDAQLAKKLAKADILTKYAVVYRYPDAEKKNLVQTEATRKALPYPSPAFATPQNLNHKISKDNHPNSPNRGNSKNTKPGKLSPQSWILRKLFTDPLVGIKTDTDFMRRY